MVNVTELVLPGALTEASHCRGRQSQWRESRSSCASCRSLGKTEVGAIPPRRRQCTLFHRPQMPRRSKRLAQRERASDHGWLHWEATGRERAAPGSAHAPCHSRRRLQFYHRTRALCALTLLMRYMAGPLALQDRRSSPTRARRADEASWIPAAGTCYNRRTRCGWQRTLDMAAACMFDLPPQEAGY